MRLLWAILAAVASLAGSVAPALGEWCSCIASHPVAQICVSDEACPCCDTSACDCCASGCDHSPLPSRDPAPIKVDLPTFPAPDAGTPLPLVRAGPSVPPAHQPIRERFAGRRAQCVLCQWVV